MKSCWTKCPFRCSCCYSKNLILLENIKWWRSGILTSFIHREHTCWLGWRAICLFRCRICYTKDYQSGKILRTTNSYYLNLHEWSGNLRMNDSLWTYLMVELLNLLFASVLNLLLRGSRLTNSNYIFNSIFFKLKRKKLGEHIIIHPCLVELCINHVET